MYRSMFQVCKQKCPFCDSKNLAIRHSFNQPPPGETSLIPQEQSYRRELVQCEKCRHFQNIHPYDFSQIYEKIYWEQTYNASKKDSLFKSRFEQIMSLDHEKSDNFGRTSRINNFFQQIPDNKKKLLDIGSGLAVFSKRMKELNWHTSIIDPDKIAISHALEQKAAHRYFNAHFPDKKLSSKLTNNFSLITFNKVLEHIKYPVNTLIESIPLLCDHGIIYVEVPDGENAYKSNQNVMRQEFFIEHYHIFSKDSLNALINKSGLVTINNQRIREPSGKFTLYVFAQARNSA